MSGKVLMVSNPCNTLSLVFRKYADKISADDITFLSLLDQMRASSAIHRKLRLTEKSVQNIFVIGNHSNTMFLDVSGAYVSGEKLVKVLSIEELIEIQKNVRTRGGEILQLQKHSASYSAALSILHHLNFMY